MSRYRHCGGIGAGDTAVSGPRVPGRSAHLVPTAACSARTAAGGNLLTSYVGAFRCASLYVSAALWVAQISHRTVLPRFEPVDGPPLSRHPAARQSGPALAVGIAPGARGDPRARAAFQDLLAPTSRLVSRGMCADRHMACRCGPPVHRCLQHHRRGSVSGLADEVVTGKPGRPVVGRS